MKGLLKKVFAKRAPFIGDVRDVPKGYVVERIERGSTACVARHRWLG